MEQPQIINLIRAIQSHVPPHTSLHISINNPDHPQIYIHGIHGSGKTTTAQLALKEVPGCIYVDENYDAIKAIVNSGRAVTEGIAAMLDGRVLPECCIVDRGALDAVVYEICHMVERKKFNMPLDALNYARVKYKKYFENYHHQNHVWLLPNNVEVPRERVIARGRAWDDPTTSPHYDILFECYVVMARYSNIKTTVSMDLIYVDNEDN